MKRRALVLIAVLAMAVSFAARPARSEAPGGGKYTYAIINPGGKPQPSDDIIKRLIKLVFKRIGEDINVVTVSPEAAAKGIADHSINFAMISQSDYVAYRDRKIPFKAILTLVSGNHTKEHRCIIVPKGFAYSGPQSLRGKTFVAPWNLGDYIGVRWFLDSKGVGTAPEKFFGPLIPAANEAAALAAIAGGKIDAGSISYGGYAFMVYTNTDLSRKIQTVDCHDLPYPPGPVVWFGTPDPEKLSSFYKLLANFDPAADPEFKAFMPVIRALKNKFYLVSDKDYDGLIKLFRDAKKKGWVADANAIGVK